MNKYLIVVLLVMIAFAAVFGQISNIPDLSDLETLVNAAWTNPASYRLFVPGMSQIRQELGAFSFPETFDTNFITGLVPVTNGNIVLLPIEVIETTNAPRERLYLNATGGVTWCASPPSGYDPVAWVTNAYGSAPEWLTGEELDAWFSDRDPSRLHVGLELISTSQVSDYIALLTNAVPGGWTNESALGGASSAHSTQQDGNSGDESKDWAFPGMQAYNKPGD